MAFAAVLASVGLLLQKGVVDLPSGKSVFVASRANDVSFAPNGAGLGYTYSDANGNIIEAGVYDLVKQRGKTLFAASEGQSLDTVRWIHGKSIEIAIESEKFKSQDGRAMVRKSVLQFDADAMTSKVLWKADFDEKVGPRLSLHRSPVLPHAIIKVIAGDQVEYLVLTLGAQDILISQDIKQAIDSGHGFAGWGVDGTAFFGEGINGSLDDDLLEALRISEFTLLYTLEQAGATKLDITPVGGDPKKQLIESRDAGSLLTIVLQPTKSETKKTLGEGANALELIPTEAVLRPVRFPGFWVDKSLPETTALALADEKLPFKNSFGNTKALWLTPNKKNPQEGTLVSASAENYWLHPNGHTVAFTSHGVLFVRTVDKPAAE